MKDRDWEEKAIIQELREQQRQREMIAKFAGLKPDKCLELERQVTRRVLPRLAEFGPVNLTVHNAPFDAYVGGCRVELKAANWTSGNRGGRYQCTIRNCAADVLVFTVVNGTDHHYIIPFAAIGRRRQIAITSYDVTAYSGQWAAYLDAWDVLGQVVASALDRPAQTSFLDNLIDEFAIHSSVSKTGGGDG